MRLLLLGSLLFVIGCGSNATQPNNELSIDRTSTEFETSVTQLDANTKIVLKNVDFQTPRRVEHIAEPVTVKDSTPDEALTTLATQVAKDLEPTAELSFLSINRGARYAYVTFQQTYRGMEIYGARITLRMNGTGDWLTSNSTLVNPQLLANLPAASRTKIASSKYFAAPHEVLEEKSVVYPRKNTDTKTLDLYVARQFVVVSLDQHEELWLWVDEQSEKAVGAYNPATALDSVQVKGTIVPNAPGDALTEAVFPNVTAIFDQTTRLVADSNGMFEKSSVLNKKAQIVLENQYVSVYNSLKSFRESSADFSVDSDTISIDQGPTLEDRNAFFWIMVAREFLTEKLKYKGLSYQLGVYTNYGNHLDNAFFMPLTKTLSLGAGGTFLKNTALSRDIVMHEFGHAVTQAIYGTVAGYEFNAMNEAFSDYFAASITEDPLIADGAMAERTGRKFLRTVDNQYVFPKDFSGVGFHDDGQMFSGALWDLRKAIGEELADKMVHEARLSQAKSISEFFLALLDIDEKADDHNPWTASKHSKQIWNAFQKHGLVSDVRFSKQADEDLTLPWKRTGCFTVN